jgi:hypothetical protein
MKSGPNARQIHVVERVKLRVAEEGVTIDLL